MKIKRIIALLVITTLLSQSVSGVFADDSGSGTVITDSGATNTGTTSSGTTLPDASTWSLDMSGVTDTGSVTPPDTGSGITNTGTTNSGSIWSGGTQAIILPKIPKWSRYIFLWDEKIATIEDQTGWTTRTIFHLSDHLGGSNIDTDGSGEVLQITDYLPYGKERIVQRNTDYKNKYWFIGKEKDNESWLNYVEARYYDSGLGRFMAQDPVFWEIGKTERWIKTLYDPQQLNSYSYSRNNPIILKDPTWEFVETAWDVANVLYDVGRVVKNVAEIAYEGTKYWYASYANNAKLKANALAWLKQDAWELWEASIDTGTDVMATAVPFVPAGGSKVARALVKNGEKATGIINKALSDEKRIRHAFDSHASEILGSNKWTQVWEKFVGIIKDTVNNYSRKIEGMVETKGKETFDRYIKDNIQVDIFTSWKSEGLLRTVTKSK